MIENDQIDAVCLPASPRNWDAVGTRIYEIEYDCFGESSLSREMMKTDLNDAETCLVILKTSSRIVGFTYAIPESDGVARIVDTVIEKEYRHKGLVSRLMTCLESELREKGYDFITRDSLVSNGYAEKIARHYSGRIVEMADIDSQWGKQRHFKIRI